MKHKTYVYLHKTLDGKVFYVGAGIKKRYSETYKKSKEWKQIAKNGKVSEIVETFDDRDDALWLEAYLIASYKALGHPIVNKSDGGRSGHHGVPASIETRKKMSMAHKGLVHSDLAKCNMRAAQRLIKEKPFICVELNKTFMTQAAAKEWLRENGYPKATHSRIGAVLHGDRKSAYGYKWEFISADPTGHLAKFLKGEKC